jgi:uncharacterized protein
MANPFNYQGPVHPEALIDRAAELEALQRAAANRVNVRLAAPRRYGKSSLLDAHIAAMQEAGHRAVRVDLYRVATVADVATRVLAAYGRLPSDARGSFDGLVRRLGVTLGPSGVTVRLGARGATAPLGPDQARAVLLEVLDLPARLHAADGDLTVVCFDEFQDLLTADDRLDGLFRSVIQHHGDAAAYVYAGSRSSLLRSMFSDHERPFYAQARPLELPPLPPDETEADLEAAFRAHGLRPGEALSAIVGFGAGHPQRTMLLAHHLFDALEDGLAPADAAPAAVDAALAETLDGHEAHWEVLDRSERAVLVALADGMAPTGAHTAREHAITRSALQRAADRLLRTERVVRRDGALVVQDPLLAEWLRRR